jgi:hypothetical protein
MDSAYAAAKAGRYGENITISAGLLIDIVDALKAQPAPTSAGVPDDD